MSDEDEYDKQVAADNYAIAMRRAEQAEAEHATLLTRYREMGIELGRLREMKVVHESCAGHLRSKVSERDEWERIAKAEKAGFWDLHAKYRALKAEHEDCRPRGRPVYSGMSGPAAPGLWRADDPHESPAPIPLLLTCPACGERHVDRGEFATKPHHTHACQSCGMVWRPALVPTVGVQYLPGYKDAP